MYKLLVVSLLLMGGGFYFLFRIQPEDVALYHELFSKKEIPTSHTSQHERSQVHKHLYLRKDAPLQISIESLSSTLQLTPTKEHLETIEVLEDVVCMMQEELFYQLPDGSKIPFEKGHECLSSTLTPMQRVRYLEAKKATFNYQTHHLVAHNAQIWEYQLPGHKPIAHAEVTASPSMSGKASSAEISFNGKEFDFSDVVCTFAQGGKLICGHLNIDHLHQRGEASQVIYSDLQGEVWADLAWIDYDSTTLKPKLVTLINNVHLQTPNHQYALADHVLYYPETQMMIFEGKESRVVFVDTERDMTLSAKTIHAQRDTMTKKDSIRGIGDVRFTLGPDEILKVKQQFTTFKGQLEKTSTR